MNAQDFTDSFDPPCEAPTSAPLIRTGHRLPVIDAQRCTGCGRCVAACELHLLVLEVERWEKFAVLHDANRCTGCSRCAWRCPFDAIRMRLDAGGPPREPGA